MSNKRICVEGEPFALPLRISETLVLDEDSPSARSADRRSLDSRRAKVTGPSGLGQSVVGNLVLKPDLSRPRLSIADAVYTAINQLDGGTEQEVMKLASKMCGKPIARAQFTRALASFDTRGVGSR
jgi:hypothetical protein